MIRCWSHCHQLAIAIGILIICSDVNALNNIITQPDDLQRDGPIIVDSLKGGTLRELTLYAGQNLTLLCKANKPIQLIQHEIPEEKIGSKFVMVQKNVSSPDPDYKYAQELALYNVDRFAVGYYGCFDNSINENFVLANITEELNNTEHAAFFYLYVDGTDSMFAPMREVVIASIGSKLVIGCRPMTPDTNVTLSLDFEDCEYERYSPKIGFVLDSDVIPDNSSTLSLFVCDFMRRNRMEQRDVIVNKYSSTGPPIPNIEGVKYFLEGETFTLSCTVKYQTNVPTVLTWMIPRGYSKGVYNGTNEREVGGGEILYNNITVANATKADAGTYICISKAGPQQQQTSFEKVFTESFVNLTKGNKKDVIETNLKVINLHTTINAYPPAETVFYKDGQKIPKNTDKYTINRRPDSADLIIRKLNVNDTGNYTLVAKNKYNTSYVMYDVRKYDAPTINFGTEPKAFPLNTTATLQCEAVGYPIPKISWFFTNEYGATQQLVERNREELSLIKVISQIQVPVRVSGNITCQASNTFNTVNSSKGFLVYDISNGFGIKDREKTWFAEGQQARLTCLASKYDYKNLTWVGNDDEDLYDYIQYSVSEFSHIAVLVIDKISLDQAGNYTCFGIKKDDSDESESILITVEATLKPIIKEPRMDKNLEVNPYQPVHFGCEVVAVPPPKITWHKDGMPLNTSDVEIYTEYVDHIIVNSTIFIKQMFEESKGKYECVATSGNEITKRAYNLQLKEKSTYMPIYFSICGGVAFVLIILVMYLAWKIRKEKQFRKELAEAGLLYFKEGVTKSLNPDLGINEQAELLPYDEKFEFPPEKLILGKQLGAGAFGVVYKAEARGIINAEETTPVAVKMVKKNADNMYIRALASELKIMVHLGKHINIVNLLGACTKNVGKRELIVIVEYCKFGNIHEYMQRHREVFIDQLTDNKEKNLGRVNKAFSCSSGSSGVHSDYYGSSHTQETDHTFVNTENTHRSERKVSETGYVQPEWRSNYRSDYSFDGRSPRPLTSRDLLAWAFQIARGMEYLANRKVLHGDLAARNVLLAEDNIVKICDFGLARSIYKNDEYQKKENSPLPVKWLAIECMTDRIFSTQSDVWSFGIVLWELFSLAKTPYPNISPQDLLHWLNEGHRLEKPPYADDRLYDVMRRCWEQRPIARPSFTQLQSMLGSFLEDNVRNHYVDLNMAYKDSNEKPEGEDYLAMVCAPDYNNMVPSPHPYVNETPMFFHPTPSPSQLQHDDEGYLQMSPANQIPFSPRAPGTKFDFDARKLNPRVTDASVHGSELTPMLTLNNLPARSGSESDHDGNSSPYLKMCPRIVEENDEVFETNHNLKNSQNTAVSNPTYSTFDVDLEKKPNNISNNYINVNVPNGLVK